MDNNSKIKMLAIVWSVCMEDLWRGWRFTMMGMGKL